jgi:DNA polymerase (family 10)
VSRPPGNAELARTLARIGVMLDIDGGNSFRVRAYKEGARVVESLAEPVAGLVDEPGALEALPGIGRGIAQHLRDLVATGTTPLLDELGARYPDEVVDLTQLHGLGPKRVRTLFDELHVRSRADLEAAARAGRLRDLPGFGEKVEQNVLKALETAAQWTGRMLLAEAWPHAQALAERIGALEGVTRVELAGSFRRRKETVGDLDLLVAGGDAAQVMRAFTKHESVADVLGQGETRSSVRLAAGLQADLRLVPEASFGAALLYFTGSKEHNIELRKLAIDEGMSLNEYGLTKGERTVAARTEEDVYRALGLEWIPPELRESHGEIALARHGKLPRLLELEDLRADLHMHTTRSDGRDTIDAMVKAAIARGYEYMAITEHSKALAMANGFDAARVRRSVGEIEAARRRHPGIHILHGLEVDILADGELDLDDDTLALLDWVIVSIHSRFEQPPAVATARALRAVSHPLVHAFGHPTGRMIGSREPVAFDVEKVSEAAAANGVAMEINAFPDRLDLSDVNARLAKAKGCRFVIDTDSHAVGHLDLIRFGVFQARRAGLTKADVWNTLPFDAFEKWRHSRRAVARLPAAGRPKAGKPVKAEAPAKRRGRPEKPVKPRPTGPAPRVGRSPRPVGPSGPRRGPH